MCGECGKCNVIIFDDGQFKLYRGQIVLFSSYLLHFDIYHANQTVANQHNKVLFQTEMIVNHCHSSTDGQEKTNSLGTAFLTLDHSCWAPETMIQVFITYFSAVALLTSADNQQQRSLASRQCGYGISEYSRRIPFHLGAFYADCWPEICDIAYLP